MMGTGRARRDPWADKVNFDRLVELTGFGGVRAAEALAQLVGQPIHSRPPSILEEGVAATSSDVYSVGVFFEFEGCLEAVAGIVLPGHASESLVRRMVGAESGALPAPLFESALMEVGNILASHLASAIANRIGEPLLPSVPSLTVENAVDAFEAFAVSRLGLEVRRIEAELADASGELSRCLLLAPAP